MSTIMVTGGSGFLGTYVTQRLAERGDRVIVFDAAQPAPILAALLTPYEKQIVYVRGQILDMAAVMRCVKQYNVERIFHGAALYDPPYSLQDPAITFEVNVNGTLNVLEAARLFEVQRVVQSSSIAVYAPRQYEPINEQHPIQLPTAGNPLGPYGASKAAAEIVGLTYYSTNGVDFIALRNSAIYGYGMRYPMYIKPMIENSVRGLPTRFETGGDMQRDYTHVKDVAQAVVKALDAPSGDLTQRAFNVGSGAMHSASEVAEAVRKVLPRADIEIGAGLSELEKSDMRARGRLDLSAIRQQLKYEPEFPLEAGIRDYVAMLEQAGK
ncbi:NAD(P)-dependent oxidoreductase [Ktedonosporobacter rubrisoli]|uniref:NAD(P)-dependent oxidoreductase n=1 Tax=Ktedonosporobacter rubrisoli TaxID=2509675 RepID=A0A4P6K179_KTERU|nr:NAD(P)-dependent oxidoreductase [Ktedonosporobacter rubrisoli]QBD81829.1 NAD(P)-dependent oxidoreductase [Ktedonosporobacter rubrisoli]